MEKQGDLLWRDRVEGRPRYQPGQLAPIPWSFPPCKPLPGPQNWSPGHCCNSGGKAPWPEQPRVLWEPSPTVFVLTKPRRRPSESTQVTRFIKLTRLTHSSHKELFTTGLWRSSISHTKRLGFWMGWPGCGHDDGQLHHQHHLFHFIWWQVGWAGDSWPCPRTTRWQGD